MELYIDVVFLVKASVPVWLCGLLEGFCPEGVAGGGSFWEDLFHHCFLPFVGIWYKSGICTVCCYDDYGTGNCLFSQKFLWIFPASCGVRCSFFSVGWFSGNAFCLYGCPTVSRERADYFRFHDVVAAFALGLSAVLHTPKSRGWMAGTSWQKQRAVLQDNR